MVWKGLMSLPASPARRFKKRRSQRKKRKKKKEKRKNSKIVPRGPGRPRGESSIIGIPKSKNNHSWGPGVSRANTRCRRDTHVMTRSKIRGKNHELSKASSHGPNHLSDDSSHGECLLNARQDVAMGSNRDTRDNSWPYGQCRSGWDEVGYGAVYDMRDITQCTLHPESRLSRRHEIFSRRHEICTFPT